MTWAPNKIVPRLMVWLVGRYCPLISYVKSEELFAVFLFDFWALMLVESRKTLKTLGGRTVRMWRVL